MRHTAKTMDKKFISEQNFVSTFDQVNDLWLKQIICDVDVVRELLSVPNVDECQMLTIVSTTSRICEIIKVMSEQFDVLNTFLPLDSFHARSPRMDKSLTFETISLTILETKLGVREDLRLNEDQSGSSVEEQNVPQYFKKEPSLLALFDAWLCRTPGINGKGFNFLKKFQNSVNAKLAHDESKAKEINDETLRKESLYQVEHQRKLFSTLFDAAQHESLIETGNRRLSHKALQGALMINIYCDHPRFQIAYKFLLNLLNIDEALTKWRYLHANAVQRLVGTSGSTGYRLLRAKCSDRYKVFVDLFNMSSFFIPRAWHPILDEETEKELDTFKHCIESNLSCERKT